MTAREGNLENCHPEKTNVDRGDNFFIILNVNKNHCLHYVGFQNNPGQVNVYVCVSYYVNSNAHATQVSFYGEPYAQKICAVDIFWNISRHQQYHPLPSSRFRVWFHHLTGDVDFFYQMSLKQSESSILHESII